MLGYEILAQALAKNGIKNTYGIVGTHNVIQASLSLNWALLSRAQASTTTVLGMSSKQPTQPAILAI